MHLMSAIWEFVTFTSFKSFSLFISFYSNGIFFLIKIGVSSVIQQSTWVPSSVDDSKKRVCACQCVRVCLWGFCIPEEPPFRSEFQDTFSQVLFLNPVNTSYHGIPWCKWEIRTPHYAHPQHSAGAVIVFSSSSHPRWYGARHSYRDSFSEQELSCILCSFTVIILVGQPILWGIFFFINNEMQNCRICILCKIHNLNLNWSGRYANMLNMARMNTPQTWNCMIPRQNST